MANQHQVEHSCLDIKAGDVLLSAHKRDFVAGLLLGELSRGSVANIDLEDSVEEKLSRIGGVAADNFELDIVRLRVPAGAEAWAVNALHSEYKRHLITASARGQIDDAVAFMNNYVRYFAVEPNFYMSLSGFTPSQSHSAYVSSFGLPSPRSATGGGVTVKILDSGIEQPAPFSVSIGRNYADPDPNKKNDVTDLEGHGTAVASLIHELAPDANIVVGKISDGRGVNEFDCLAGLVDHSSANVLNLSLEFGDFSQTACVCGRKLPSTRSAVFENAIDQLLNAYSQLIIVVAAGNQYDMNGPLPPGPAYPARFADVVAVGCIDSAYNVSGRYGAVDHNGDQHNNLYFLPGGGATEFVGSTGNPATNHRGTSFSAAYASGLLAVYLSEPGNSTARSAAMPALRGLAASSGFGTSFNASDHGNGEMRVY